LEGVARGDFAEEDFVVEFVFREVVLDLEVFAGADAGLVSAWGAVAREDAPMEPQAIPSAIHRTDVRES